MLRSLSHTTGLEASAASAAPAPRVALANPAVVLGLVVHDLVRGRLLARTLRDRTRLLRRLASTSSPTGQDLCRLREGAGGLADARPAYPGPRGPWPPGPSLRRALHGGRVYSPGLRRFASGLPPVRRTGTPPPFGQEKETQKAREENGPGQSAGPRRATLRREPGSQDPCGRHAATVGHGDLAFGARRAVVVAFGHRQRQRTGAPPAVTRQLAAGCLLVADAGYVGYHLMANLQAAGIAFLLRLSSRAPLYVPDKAALKKNREGLVYYWPYKVQIEDLPPIPVRLWRLRGERGDVWLITNVLDEQRLPKRTAGKFYRWRWRNEGLFRTYKRTLGKVKLMSRTVVQVHREAEGSL